MKISALPAAGAVTGNEPIVVLKGGIAMLSTTGVLVDARLAAPGAAAGMNYRPGQSVGQVLDKLLYAGVRISALAVAPAQAEIGSTVATVTVTWAIAGAITAQTLKGVALPVGDRSKAFANVAATTLFDLAITDGNAPGGPAGDAAQASIAFLPKFYCGVLDAMVITDAQIRAFGNQDFATTRARAVTFNASAGGYPWYAWPAALGGLAGVTVGGLAFTDYTVTTRDVVNASGATVSMNLLHFNNRQTGGAIGVVFA